MTVKNKFYENLFKIIYFFSIFLKLYHSKKIPIYIFFLKNNKLLLKITITKEPKISLKILI